MHDNAPVIAGKEFLDADLALPAHGNVEASVPRRALEATSATSLDKKTCGITVLWLENQSKARRSKKSLLRSDAHADIPPADASQRFRVSPLAEALKIRWKTKGREHVASLTLELFRRADDQPIWTRKLSWNLGESPKFGETPFDGSMATKESVQTLERKRDEIDRRRRELDALVLKLQEDLRANGAVETLKQEESALKDKIQGLVAEIEALGTKQKELAGARSKLKEDHERFIGELDGLRDDAKAKEGEVSRCQGENEQVRLRIQDLDGQIATRKAALVLDPAATDNELAGLQAELDDKRGKSASRAADLEERQGRSTKATAAVQAGEDKVRAADEAGRAKATELERVEGEQKEKAQAQAGVEADYKKKQDQRQRSEELDRETVQAKSKLEEAKAQFGEADMACKARLAEPASNVDEAFNEKLLPDAILVNAHSPYKLKISVTAARPKVDVLPPRWLYVDVPPNGIRFVILDGHAASETKLHGIPLKVTLPKTGAQELPVGQETLELLFKDFAPGPCAAEMPDQLMLEIVEIESGVL